MWIRPDWPFLCFFFHSLLKPPSHWILCYAPPPTPESFPFHVNVRWTNLRLFPSGSYSLYSKREKWLFLNHSGKWENESCETTLFSNFTGYSKYNMFYYFVNLKWSSKFMISYSTCSSTFLRSFWTLYESWTFRTSLRMVWNLRRTSQARAYFCKIKALCSSIIYNKQHTHRLLHICILCSARYMSTVWALKFVLPFCSACGPSILWWRPVWWL